MSAWISGPFAVRRYLPAIGIGLTLSVVAAVAQLGVGQSQVPSGARQATGGRQPEIISIILLRKAACDRVQPGFADLSAGAFRRWRRFGTDAIDAVERSSEFKAKLAEVGQLPVGSGQPRDRQEVAALCGDDFIAYLEALGRDADPRLATPEGAWRTFVAALQAGDRTAALAVMTDTARDMQRRQMQEQSTQALQDTGNSFVSLELKAPLGPMVVGVASRRDGRTVTVFFDISWNGDWRIASL